MESEFNSEYVTNYYHKEIRKLYIVNGMSKEECRGTFFPSSFLWTCKFCSMLPLVSTKAIVHILLKQ